MIIYFTKSSPDLAVRTLVGMLRLSNRYPKGVARREFGEVTAGTWDVVVVSGFNGPDDLFSSHIIFNIVDGTARDIHRQVEEEATRLDLI